MNAALIPTSRKVSADLELSTITITLIVVANLGTFFAGLAFVYWAKRPEPVIIAGSVYHIPKQFMNSTCSLIKQQTACWEVYM